MAKPLANKAREALDALGAPPLFWVPASGAPLVHRDLLQWVIERHNVLAALVDAPVLATDLAGHLILAGKKAAQANRGRVSPIQALLQQITKEVAKQADTIDGKPDPCDVWRLLIDESQDCARTVGKHRVEVTAWPEHADGMLKDEQRRDQSLRYLLGSDERALSLRSAWEYMRATLGDKRC